MGKNRRAERTIKTPPHFREERAAAQKIIKQNRLDQLRLTAEGSGQVPWAILRYRHIIRPEETPLPLSPISFVLPQTFETHLSYLKHHCSPLSLSELMFLISENKSLPPRAVAVTIDCGHADAFLNAFPLLIQYSIPATICLPTGYIESNSFFPDDRIAIGLAALHAARQKIPRFEFLPKDSYRTLLQLSPTLELNDQTFWAFLDLFRTATEQHRNRILAIFAAELSEYVQLPDYEDFLRWTEVKKMSEHGVGFASMGHRNLIAPLVSPQLFRKDVLASLETLVEKQIPVEKCFCFPEGVLDEQRRQALHEFGYRMTLSLGEFPHPTTQTAGPAILGRIPISQWNAAEEELFACRIWRIPLLA